MQIFLLEDDPIHAAHFVTSVTTTGTAVRHFGRPKDFLSAIARQRPDLVVLDWLLPDMDGCQVLSRVRELFSQTTPVMMLTCVDSQDSVVNALNAGADDFLVKPLRPSVLRARIDAFRPRFDAATATAPVQTVRFGPYRLDRTRQAAFLGDADTPMALTAEEFELAWTLFTRPDRLVSKADLAAAAFGKECALSAHALPQHMHAIRRQLCLSDHGIRLGAVYGWGYRLERSPVSP